MEIDTFVVVEYHKFNCILSNFFPSVMTHIMELHKQKSVNNI